MNRKLAAHYIVTGKGDVLKNGIITINDSGEIVELTQSNKNLQEISGLEFYSGVIVPGFVNTHCHLELSHLKGKIRENTGLPGFVSQINQIRQSNENEIINAAKKADLQMWHNGIVAVGDISNTNHSFTIKLQSKIAYHTFLEIFSTNPALASKKVESALELQNELNTNKLSSSIVPHAPYSVTLAMFDAIKNLDYGSVPISTIHNQECFSENELYQSKSGKLYDVFTNLGVDFGALPKTGKNSLESIMEQMPKQINTILVHNTFTNAQDIEKAEMYFEKLFWCMCPNANLYIENKLPNIDLFRIKNQSICIGTDSLASNHQLSVFEELKTIAKNYPKISFEELIEWGTRNGAEALGLDNKLGTIAPFKIPGINLIRKFDLQNFKLKPESELKRLL